MPASQAGRRRFEPGRPLKIWNDFDIFRVVRFEIVQVVAQVVTSCLLPREAFVFLSKSSLQNDKRLEKVTEPSEVDTI